MDELKIEIPIAPRTKKNSQSIAYVHGRPIVVQSKAYKQYEKACALYVHRKGEPISTPVNVKCVYYMPTRRRVDITNLMEATHDILVKYGVLADDNSSIVYSVDGSRVFYDKDHSRTEITITEVEKEGKTDGN